MRMVTWGRCKSCLSLGKEWPMIGEEHSSLQKLWIFHCSNPNHVHSTWRTWNGYTFLPAHIMNRTKKRSWIGKGGQIQFYDGKNVRTVSQQRLREFRSRVTSHEGELLTGAQGRAYQDKYALKYLGKDLAGTYNQNEVIG